MSYPETPDAHAAQMETVLCVLETVSCRPLKNAYASSWKIHDMLINNLQYLVTVIHVLAKSIALYCPQDASHIRLITFKQRKSHLMRYLNKKP